MDDDEDTESELGTEWANWNIAKLHVRGSAILEDTEELLPTY